MKTWVDDQEPYSKNISFPCRRFDLLENQTSPQTDNIKFEFLALDCDYLNTYFAYENKENKNLIRKVCVDVAAGKKAQIRLANPHTYFNITNSARFENIEFTGEDLFAVSTFKKESI